MSDWLTSVPIEARASDVGSFSSSWVSMGWTPAGDLSPFDFFFAGFSLGGRDFPSCVVTPAS